MQQIKEILSQIPLLAGTDRNALQIHRLDGLLNRNFKVTGPGLSVVVRLAGPGTEAYVDHRTEASNARAAARTGVAPEVLYSDDCAGILVTRFVEGAVALDAARAGSAPYLARIGRKLRALHTVSRRFSNAFDPFRQLDRYVAVLEAQGVDPTPDFLDATARLEDLRELPEARAWAAAPCHCDPLPANILDDGQRLYIIDYEFSGNCDPLFDLGDFSGEADLGEAQDRALLTSYFGGTVPPQALDLLVAYKAISLLVAVGWAQVQVASGNDNEDFAAFGALRLARCWEILESRDFGRLNRNLAAHGAEAPICAAPHPFQARDRGDDDAKTWV